MDTNAMRHKADPQDTEGVIASHNGHQGSHMRIGTVREFRNKATGLLRSRKAITRRGTCTFIATAG
jgi:hypothetical protein